MHMTNFLTYSSELVFGWFLLHMSNNSSLYNHSTTGWEVLGFESPIKAREFSLLQNAQTGCGAQPAFHSIGRMVLLRE
jgi:hypothetical protein